MLFIVLLLLVLNGEKCYNCKNNDNDENEAYFLDISSREVLSFFNCFCSGLLGCFTAYDQFDGLTYLGE